MITHADKNIVTNTYFIVKYMTPEVDGDGAAIYAASLLCKEKQTQSAVAAVANVTEVTIRNRYQEQIEAMEMNQGVE